jgi:hypothetical protein
MMSNASEQLRYWLRKAQPAPWGTFETPCKKHGVKYELYAADYDVADFWSEGSAEFCALARNLLPEILAELDSLRAELAALKEVARG